MGHEVETHDAFAQEDHQVAYVFDPDEDDARRQRPAKRRRVSKQARRNPDVHDLEPLFVPLLNGAEKPEAVRLRQRLFEESWAKVDGRIQGILRDSNSATLDQVSAFVAAAESECVDHITSAFIITGPNIASQDLLFEQLSEALQRSSASKFVRLRSSEATTLKGALKKTIRDAMATTFLEDEDEGLQVESGQDGRRYLDYDLEALEAFIKPQKCGHVFVAFQDSEGFDSTLLSDLVALFQCVFFDFRQYEQSVNLLQLVALPDIVHPPIRNRHPGRAPPGSPVEIGMPSHLRRTVRLRAGGDDTGGCVQRSSGRQRRAATTGSAIASGHAGSTARPSRGHSSIHQLVEANPSKYAYMCHFYANPLGIITSLDALQSEVIQPEHIDALRNLPSFRNHVERAVQLGDDESLQHAKSLIQDDDYLLAKVRDSDKARQQWIHSILRAILVLEAAGAQRGTFSKAYVNATVDGVQISEQSALVDCIRRMGGDELSAMLTRIIALFKEGDSSLNLGPSVEEQDVKLQGALGRQLVELDRLRATAESEGFPLRSKYSGHSKVMRTTVIAQRVQLSQDSAALRDEDKQLTAVVDEVTKLLTTHFADTDPNAVPFSECWLYDSRSPSREVFVPRPHAVFERSLGRPHDYLGCACCKPGEEGIQATLPATAILYRLYLETGSLINVADLWSAFHALVGQQQRQRQHEVEGDERLSLVMFYRGLAELRALGFVKASKKKADHIAKVKWL
ncbi:Origin recognition complex subunit 3 [Tolypocladium ophioglossoides CBS 100239]|uniref:Origin recognition complex subunit 3 n=1 Tax=Tolypocladium ophioglossoides (strain CBS 100239) TaxID=1163406 RepID=A0A0L0N7X4_TOLOC|nr:Origin recognition complex subunit 3 [Tolypocladium ophioglossoides CBS 100239]